MEKIKKSIAKPFSLVESLFIWASGANAEVLSQCPTDKNKYYGIGGTIVFTALMASFAGGYAFHTAFKDPYLSVFFGLFWGALIFNLDRYIVSTFGVGDGKRTISKQELIEAAPRLLMAMVLGFVIATPLELKIFEKEIQTQVERLKIEKKEELISVDTTFQNSLSAKKLLLSQKESDIQQLQDQKTSYLNDAGKAIDQRRDELRADIAMKNTELEAAEREYKRRFDFYILAKRDTTGRYSQNQINLRKSESSAYVPIRDNIRDKRNELSDELDKLGKDKVSVLAVEQNRIDSEIDFLNTQRKSLQDAIDQMEITLNAKVENYANVAENYDGFAAHLEALSVLTERKPIIFYTKWLITILFIFIEIAPILFKMMTERGPYDDIIDRMRHEENVRQKLLISNINEEVNTAVKTHSRKNAQKLESELLANEQLLNSIAAAQAEIAQVAIDAWKKEQIELVKNDPSRLIKSAQRGQ